MNSVMTFADLERDHPGIKEYAKDLFVGNECGTDEYRETQPEKGLSYIARWAEVRDTVLGYSSYGDLETLTLIRNWLAAIVQIHGEDHSYDSWSYAYAGAPELEPVLAAVFDTLWDNDEHPYNLTPAELLNEYLEDKEVRDAESNA